MSNSVSQLPLHVRAEGHGPTVICLHSSGSSSSQWQPLIQQHQRHFRLVGVDFYGHGRSAACRAGDYSLQAEADAVVPLITASKLPVHLMSHSYGSAVALALALRYPHQVASVALYEPVLFSLLERESIAYKEIEALGLAIVADARAGRGAAASKRFVDYWSGAGSWSALSPDIQSRIAARISAVADHFEALLADPLPWPDLMALRVPTLLVHGDQSPRSSIAVAGRLATLAAVSTTRLSGVGHMGPITHPHEVLPLYVEHALRHVGKLPLAA
jgi:pimeloyl-ACP methyl ester carboxylesterase